jgi:HAMP domain-containing protein
VHGAGEVMDGGNAAVLAQYAAPRAGGVRARQAVSNWGSALCVVRPHPDSTWLSQVAQDACIARLGPLRQEDTAAALTHWIRQLGVVVSEHGQALLGACSTAEEVVELEQGLRRMLQQWSPVGLEGHAPGAQL